MNCAEAGVWFDGLGLGRVGGGRADAVGEGLGEMGGGDEVGGVKVGDGLGDFDNFEVAASGKVKSVGGGA